VKIEEKKETKIVLTRPLTLVRESESDASYKAPNFLQRILSLFKNVRPGSDLTRFQLPPQFNLPKSQLQCYGESVYCTAMDMLSMCNSGQDPVDRFISVVAWCISTTRPVNFGVAPYNPILGETHHVSKGTLNLFFEQISHHPPVTALHATDEKENIEMIWCQQPVPKFNGTSVEAKVHGKRVLKLLNHCETYEMNCPHLLLRILPVPGADWIGKVNIRCLETGLEAKLSYRSPNFLGMGSNHRMIKGKILDSSLKLLYEVDGHWDRIVNLKDTKNGEVRVIYDAKEVISGLETPILKDKESVWPTESVNVWGELSQAILSKEWDKAREAKLEVEERQRELMREKELKGETWISKHFLVSNKKEGWECSPIHKSVPAAPIIVAQVLGVKVQETNIVLTKPFSLGNEADSELPPLFNFPKSQLQCYGESIYSTSSDLLSRCNTGQSPLERLISVVAWSISTTRPAIFGVAPYNPTLGETHHVSHHPPVSALHATYEKENIQIIWSQYPVPKFNGITTTKYAGTSVEAQVHGKRQLKLLNHGETYEMNSPHLLIKILPVPGIDWVGNVNIRCIETGLVAELCYMNQSFFGFGGSKRLIKGKIIDSSSLKILCEVNGHWDSTVTLKETSSEEVRVIYDAKEVISGLQAPTVKDAENVWPTESARVWSELSQAILSKDWEKARETKKAVEERQRELLKERESKGETWVPKHFILCQSKEGIWDCLPIQKWVPASPIVT
ncbi:Oxysterol-binding protein-related protein 4B, partial [Mucuna pruriens]